MGQYKKIKCPTCGISVEIWRPEEIPTRCPACKENFKDALDKQGGGTGLTTAQSYFHHERTNTN